MLGFDYVAISFINRVTTLMGFSCKKMYGCFARKKQSGCNNEVVILMG